MNIKMLKSAMVGLILSISGFANAGLIDNTNTTIDDINNLEWLDFSFTVGMSYNDILSSQYIINDGYRIATSSEIISLWTSAGGVVGNVVANNTPISNLFGLMGCMSYIQGLSCDGIGEQWTAALYDTGNLNTYDITIIDTGFDSTGYMWLNWQTNIAKNTSYRNDVAAYLVRNTTQVPEPSTLAIFALGIVGLATRRFKKQS